MGRTEQELLKEVELWKIRLTDVQTSEEIEEEKEAGLSAGGGQATVASTQFTQTFGGGVKGSLRRAGEQEEEEDEENVKKCLSEDRACTAGWGNCRGCPREVCKDNEKYDALHTMDLIKSKDGRVFIAGYASPHVVDDEGHRIELPALRLGLEQFMFVPQFRNVMVAHTGIQVGTVVESAKDASGKLHKTHVDAGGLYVVCELRADIQPGKEVIEAVKSDKLNSFSIRGRGLERAFKCEDGRCFWSISKLELYEITVCKRGVNPTATFTLLKSAPVKVSVQEADYIEENGTIGLEGLEVGGTSLEQTIDKLLESVKELVLLYAKGKNG